MTATTIKGCKHARAGFSFIRDNRTKTATKVGFGGPQGISPATVVQRINDAGTRGFLSQQEKSSMLEILSLANAAGVYPLVKIGSTGIYAVFDNRSRTNEHGWAHVKDDNPRRAAWSRRLNEERRLLCKVRSDVCCCVVDRWIDEGDNFQRSQVYICAQRTWCGQTSSASIVLFFSTLGPTLQPTHSVVLKVSIPAASRERRNLTYFCPPCSLCLRVPCCTLLNI